MSAVDKKTPSLLIVSAAEPTGSAGLATDLRTSEHFGVLPLVVVTAVTVQDGGSVERVLAVPPEVVREQIVAACRSAEPAAIKIGLVPSVAIVRVLAEVLASFSVPIVLDPVSISSSGDRLTEEGTSAEVRDRLLENVTVLTANLSEAEQLGGAAVTNAETAQKAAQAVARFGPEHVVIKGGHSEGAAVDYLFSEGTFSRGKGATGDGSGELTELRGQRIDGIDLRGSGCAFATALACELAMGAEVVDATRSAGDHVRDLIGLSTMSQCGVYIRGERGGRRADHRDE